MGYLSTVLKGNDRTTFPSNRADRGDGRRLWEEVFGSVSKEDVKVTNPKVQPGGSYTNSAVSGENALARLLDTLKSRAPGGWTDNRYEQTKHFMGVNYVAIHRTGVQLEQSEFQVYRKDRDHPDGMVPVSPDDPPEGDRHCTPYDLVTLLEHPNEEDSFGDLLYCFPAGTRVRLADGTWKPIENVRLRDEVITAEGNVRRVRQLHTHRHKGHLIRLKLWGHRHLRMTPGHKVLTKRGYVEAQDLVKGDWVSLPRCPTATNKVLQTQQHISGETVRTKTWRADKSYGRVAEDKPSTGGIPWAHYNKVPDFLELTHGLGRIFGFFLAEGHLEKYSVVWSFGTHERDTFVAELQRLLADELGLESSTRVCNADGTVTQVAICGKLWVRLFKSLCGEGAATKRLHSDLVSGPREFLEGLFTGWGDGDGCYSEKNKTRIATVSHDLALGMFDVANRLGLRPAILKLAPQKVKKSSKFSIKSRLPLWEIFIKSDKDNYRVALEDSVMWRRVEDTEEEGFDGDVFDIGVEDQHSYIAEGIGVHNSWNQQLDLTGMALTWMVPNKLGRPFKLFVMPTALCPPGPMISEQYPEGYYQVQPVYPYGPFTSFSTPLSASGARIPAQWMMRFKYTHPLLRYEGFSPQTALRLQSDSVEQIDRSRFYKMLKSINPDAVLQLEEAVGAQPLPDAEIQRIVADFMNMIYGPENSGGLIVAPPGGRLETFGQSPKEMDWPAGWEQLMSFLLAGFGITKPAAGMIEDASYSSLFATLKQFYWLTLEPKVNKFAAKITRFLAPYFGDNLIVKIRCKRIDDHDVTFTKIDKGINAKCMTKNEVRVELGYPVTEEEWGDEIAGYEEPPEQPGMGMPGMEGAEQGNEDEDGLGPFSQMMEDDEIENERPRAGKLAEGSLGPRMKAINRLQSNGKKLNVFEKNGRHK